MARAFTVLTLLVALLVGGSQPTATGSDDPTPSVWVFGDSIAAGTWLADPATQSWPAQIDELMGPGQQVRNLAVGGQAVAYSGPGLQRMDEYVLQTLAATPAAELPRVIVFAGGLNDFIRAYDVGPTRWAVYQLGTTIAATYPGVAFLPTTITPYRSDSGWLVALSDRRAQYNAWARDMYGQAGQLIDSGDVLTAGAYADPRYYGDALHPNAGGAEAIADTVYTVLSQKGLA